jgi:hypothetical protein
MPRRDSSKARDSRAPREERVRSNGRSVNVDEQVLALREANSSYSGIARRLSLRRATDAHRAFIRAVRLRSGDEQRNLIASEQARLNTLELRIRDRDAADPEKLERRLQALEKLRAALP